MSKSGHFHRPDGHNRPTLGLRRSERRYTSAAGVRANYSALTLPKASPSRRIWTLAGILGVVSVGPLMFLKDRYPWAPFVLICLGAVFTSLAEIFRTSRLGIPFHERDSTRASKILAHRSPRFSPELVWLLFDPKTRDKIIEPAMAELREEFLIARSRCATKSGRKWVQFVFALRKALLVFYLVAIWPSRMFHRLRNWLITTSNVDT